MATWVEIPRTDIEGRHGKAGMSASPTFLSTRWEAKTGDSSGTHKPANLVDAAANKRSFLRQGAKWGLTSTCTNTCPLTHMHTPRYTHNTHKDCKMLKNALLAVIIGFCYRVMPLSSLYLWSSISEKNHTSANMYAADTDKNKVSVFHGFMFLLIFAKDVFSLLGCFGRLIN